VDFLLLVITKYYLSQQSQHHSKKCKEYPWEVEESEEDD
jgi:hypothetical protein